MFSDEQLIGMAKARGIHDADAAVAFGRAVGGSLLFVVWIDTNCGEDAQNPDWEMNSAHMCPAKPLQDALDEASNCRANGFPTIILPESMTPRADGLFSNPLTDPEA